MNKIFKIIIIALTVSCLLCMSVTALSRMGSVGSEVTALQNALKNKGYYNYTKSITRNHCDYRNLTSCFIA